MRILAAMMGASVFLAGPVYAKLMSDPEQQTPPARDVVAETQLYCLTLALYFEGGSTYEPEIGQRYIARVITERAKADRPYWGGNTICGVVFYKSKGVCQFSFACLPLARRTPHKNALWRVSEAIAKDALNGGNDDDTDSSIRYYMDPRLSALKNVCAFRKEFVPVTRAGTHEFFREATAAERSILAKTEPDACRRYAELLKAKKKKKWRHARAHHHKARWSRTASR